MQQVTIQADKANISKVLEHVRYGAEVVLAEGETPLAKVVPLHLQQHREFGALRGRVSVGPDFFEPLPEEELRPWE